MVEFVLRGFRRPGAMVEGALGHLEREILNRLWADPAPLSVRALEASFGGALAYTTLMTTLDRLHRKGLVDRDRAGRAFLYRARFTREQLDNGVATDLIDAMLGTGPDAARPVMSTFVDAVEQRDAALLDELAKLIREKQKAGRKR
jgi:BlaI family transcriptional regulator, penicillinase repressor